MFTLNFCLNLVCRWEKYQNEEEAALGRGKRQRKAVSYREVYAPHPSETMSEVICFNSTHQYNVQVYKINIFWIMIL